MQTIEVHYSIEIDDKDKDQLYKLAHELGHTFGDAGPILSIKRLLVDVGIEGSFPADRYHNIYPNMKGD